MILFPEDATLRQYTGYSFDSDGYQDGKDGLTTTPIKASFQPADNTQVPEEVQDQLVEWECFLDTTAYPKPKPIDEINKVPADEVLYDGTVYRVVWSKVWPTLLKHAHFFLSRDPD